MNRIYVCLICIFLLAASIRATEACTIISAKSNHRMLAAANEDANNPNAKMWFVPASDTTYGRVCFGFDADYRIAESGMNDRGLFIDVNALNADTGWKAEPGKPDWEEWEGWFGTGVPDGVLAKCATVSDALRIFERYNLLTFARVKYLIADRSGASAIVEWSRDSLRIIETNGDYQVSTNFLTSDYAPGNEPCMRFEIANRMLGEAGGEISCDLMRAVMSATCFEYFSFSPTIYSICCDLASGDVTVYLFHNFEEALSFNLHERLAAGAARHRLHDCFENHSYSYRLFLEKAGGLRDPEP